MRPKRFFGNVALFIVSIVVALAIGEAFLRFFYKDHVILFPRYHTDAQYGEFTIRRQKPNSTFWHTSIDGSWEFVTNAQGFRNDADFSYEKTQGVLRILSLGDSHTQGYEVRQKQTFSAVVERYLQGEGVQAEVINAGVSGFSTAEALVFLENEGIKYHPDVVVLGFFANDLVDNIKAGIFVLTEDTLNVKKKEHIPGVKILNAINSFGLLRWLSENSYVYSFGFNNVWKYAKRLMRGKAKAALTTEYAIAVDEVDTYQTELAAKLVERMYKFCRENNIKLIVLDIPRQIKNNEIRSSVPTELKTLFQQNSDAFIDSKETLREYRNVAELHLPNGSRHISEFTHLIYGVEIARTVLNMEELGKARSSLHAVEQP